MVPLLMLYRLQSPLLSDGFPLSYYSLPNARIHTGASSRDSCGYVLTIPLSCGEICGVGCSEDE